LAAAQANRHGQRDSTMILVCFQHGLSAGELCEPSRQQWAFKRSYHAHQVGCMRLVWAVVAVVIISRDALAEIGIEHVVKAVSFAIGEPKATPARTV
jgi:hypothetical protein